MLSSDEYPDRSERLKHSNSDRPGPSLESRVWMGDTWCLKIQGIKRLDGLQSLRTPWYKRWWRNRTTKQKHITYAVLSIIFFALLIIALYFLFNVEAEVCTTSKCVRTSMELLNSIDSKIDPCEDFYRFSCGNFLQNTNLDNRGSRSVRDIMEEEIQTEIRNMLEQPISLNDPKAINLAKKFYRACMNETAIEAAGLKEIKEIFKQIGGWPSLEGSRWSEKDFDWKNSVYKLRELGINFELFFLINIDQDEEDPTKNILYISDPAYRTSINAISFLIPSKLIDIDGYIKNKIEDTFYSPSEISNDVKAMYLDYMVDIAIYFGVDRYQARKDQREVLNFFLQLAKISSEAQTVNGTSHIYNPFSPSELQHEFPSIPWFQFINTILKPAERFTYDDVISVSQPIYIKKLEGLLQSTPKRILANFVVWQTFQHLINYLPSAILDRGYEYLEKVNGKNTRKPRWSICIKATEDRLDSVLSAAYIEKYFDDDTRLRVMDIIRNIKMQFKHNMRKLEWLDFKTKNMAVEKLLTSVEEIVSYKDFIESFEQDFVYDNLKINESEFLKSALDLDYINLNVKFGKFRERRKDNWLRLRGFVTGLNIVFSPKENILRFPIGIFRGIYYQKDRPQYMNYGVLGSIIAHEISHIFIQAEYEDTKGELRSWWSSQSLLNYEEKLQCLSNQYASFIVPELGRHLNSSRTRDEDMADLAGMKVSYDTYINWVQERGAEPRLPGLNYSPNQLFWISSAIHHCSKYSANTLQRYITNYEQSPQHFRVNGPLQNLQEFAFDFGCTAGSKMNPPNKCEIW